MGTCHALLRASSLLLGTAALLGCDSRTLLVVTVEDRPRSSATLEAVVWSGGERSTPERFTTDRFGLRLPAGTAGDVTVDVEALGADDDAQADGRQRIRVEGGGRMEVRVPLTPLVCSGDRWCWGHPRPHGRQLVAVAMTARGEAWIADQHGGLYRHDGVRTVMADNGLGGRGGRIDALWSDGRGTLIAVGYLMDGGRKQGFVHRLSGGQWTDLTPPYAAGGAVADFRSVWGTGPDDLWVNDEQSLHQFDGRAWRRRLDATGTSGGAAIGGTGPGQVWVTRIQDNGEPVVYLDGASWVKPQCPGLRSPVRAFFGAGPGDMWILSAAKGTLHHFDGQRCVAVPTGADRDADVMAGTGPADIWAMTTGLLLHYDGSAWSEVTDGAPRGAPRALSGSAGDDVWAAGDDGEILRFDGRAWTRLAPDGPDDLFDVQINAIWGAGPGALWLVGSHGSGTAAGRGYLARFDGHEAEEISLPEKTDYLNAVWGSGPADVWAVGNLSPPDNDATALHYDGRSWIRIRSGAPYALAAIWGSGPADVWAVGNGNEIVRWDGAAWRPSRAADTDPGAILLGVWGSGAGDVWAVGARGKVLRWQGASWSEVPLGDPDEVRLNTVVGTGAKDVWLGGTAGGVRRTYHYDGTALRRRELPGFPAVAPIGARAGGEVILLADDVGALIRGSGGTWRAEQLGASVAASRIPLLLDLGEGGLWLAPNGAGLLRQR